MDMLKVEKGKIVDAKGRPVRLRGTCAGGWMNMENFINGYPGAEYSLRAVFADVLGESKARFFFERLLDYFLAEEDIAFMKECGATVVRLPLNYHHFESDAEPFKYLEAGFKRLEEAVKWCAKYNLYAIFDMHAVQGCQNTDWHCDNASRYGFFWHHPHFQDRFVALWEEIARRFVGNPAVAGYNVMNEPLTISARSRFSFPITPNWDRINSIYRRVVKAIRTHDPNHIIFLEGDNFSGSFEKLDEPFDENLVYSSHNYNEAGSGPGEYPGMINGRYWDRKKQVEVFLAHQGTQFTQEYNVPLWIGEFGVVFNGPPEELNYRLKAIDDQIGVFEEYDAHWTTWNYKDVGVMGWLEVNPESDYMQIIAPVLKLKYELSTDFWMQWLPPTKAKKIVYSLAELVEKTINDPEIDTDADRLFFSQAALSGYVAGLMQPAFAKLFKGMSEIQIDKVLQSFAFDNCKPRKEFLEILKKYMFG